MEFKIASCKRLRSVDLCRVITFVVTYFMLCWRRLERCLMDDYLKSASKEEAVLIKIKFRALLNEIYLNICQI